MMIDTPRLLITDDDRDFRQTVKLVVEDQGFETIQASDGWEAVQIVKRESVHIVVIDMHMPRMNGLDAIREIKSLRTSLPCILISADLDDEIRQNATSAFTMLEKPLRVRIFRDRIHSAMKATYGWDANR